MKTRKYFQLSSMILAFMTGASVFAAEKPMMRLNPFELPRGIYSKDNIPKETPQALNLEAIFTLNGKKVATISGQNFVAGDFAYGKRVMQIFRNRVILDNAGKEENLILERSKFMIRKHMQN